MQDRYDLYFREHQQEMIDTLRTLVKYPSVRGVSSTNAPFGEACADVLNTFLEISSCYGFKTKNIDSYAGTVEYGDNIRLGILGHLDVVPVGNNWTYPPFDVTQKDGALYGRGTIDDKGPTVAALFAMRAIKDLNIPLSYGVRLIAGCAEETGSEDMEYYTEKEAFPELLFTPDSQFPLINTEKGRVHGIISAPIAMTAAPCCVLSIKAGQVFNAVPDTATAVLRGFTEQEIRHVIDHTGTHGLSFSFEETEDGLTFVVHGKAAHGSTPEEGINALTGLIKILSLLPLDGCDSTQYIHALNHLFAHGETNGEHVGIACEDEISGALTLAFCCFELNDTSCTGHLDIRFPLCTNKETIMDTFRSHCTPYGFEVCCTGVEPHHVPEDSDFVQTLLSVYANVTGLDAKPIATGGGTYVHDTENGVAFGAEFPGDENNMHGADEHIDIEKWIQSAVIYAHAIETLCA